jgi:hypothetical protein
MDHSPQPGERRITAKLVRQGEDEFEFNHRFWREAGTEARFEAAWEMVLEARSWKGLSGDEPRLQRHVLRVERR